jgi:DNA adenine methylase
MNSPFRYAGGKFYARKLILSRIPFHEVYIEPFAGGGSIFFAKDKVDTNLLNDLDNDLINVYKHIRDKPTGLINFLKCSNFREIFSKKFLENRSDDEILPAKKDLHTFFKKEFEPKNNLEKAGTWYYLNRPSLPSPFQGS